MITVNDKKEAWNLASRLFPTDYSLDESRSANAEYNIYYSTEEGMDAWISDLNDRLELNYPNGSSENIWIKDKGEVSNTKVIVGRYYEEKVFGDVTAKTVKEIAYDGVVGLVTKTLSNGDFGIELTLSNGKTAKFSHYDLAYIKFNN